MSVTIDSAVKQWFSDVATKGKTRWFATIVAHEVRRRVKARTVIAALFKAKADRLELVDARHRRLPGHRREEDVASWAAFLAGLGVDPSFLTLTDDNITRINILLDLLEITVFPDYDFITGLQCSIADPDISYKATMPIADTPPSTPKKDDVDPSVAYVAILKPNERTWYGHIIAHVIRTRYLAIGSSRGDGIVGSIHAAGVAVMTRTPCGAPGEEIDGVATATFAHYAAGADLSDLKLARDEWDKFMVDNPDANDLDSFLSGLQRLP